MGYHQAGFDVVGVDIVRHARYPFEFRQRDVMTMTAEEIRAEFDAVHASPICQGDTVLRHAPGTKKHPDLITPTLALLKATGLPWVLENVEGARWRLENPILLCGSMFDLGTATHRLERHRLFQTNWGATAPGPCRHSEKPVVGIYGGHARVRSAKHGGRGTRDVWPNGHKPVAAEAMGIDWASLAEMSEAIPPAYTRHLGSQLLAHLSAQREAA